jgi:NAD(P)H-flavin reductase
VFGHGEAAFTLSSLPGSGSRRRTATITVRQVGTLTRALFALPVGAIVGIRGPFGRGFPLDEVAHPTLYVAGGCGLAPLKAAVDWQLGRRPAGTRLAVVYGARNPASRILGSALVAWKRARDTQVVTCVEEAPGDGDGPLGTVLDFLEIAMAHARPTRAALCGPPPMLARVAERLCREGLDPAHIHLAIERYMKCGTGECGHCYVNHRYVCTDGPVFSYAELRALPDAFGTLAIAQASAAC